MMNDDRQRHFQTVHAEGGDFWNDPRSRYEQGKRKAILTHLSRPRYDSVLEVGCSTGLLSRDLAERADRFLGVDLSDTAIVRTRNRLIGLARARARVAPVPACWPARRFDLILLAEMLYYLTAVELDALAARCVTSLMDQGEIVVVCYLGETQTPIDGRQSADRFTMACTKLVRFEVNDHVTTGRYLHRTLIYKNTPRGNTRGVARS